jgi:hypothetical protein
MPTHLERNRLRATRLAAAALLLTALPALAQNTAGTAGVTRDTTSPAAQATQNVTPPVTTPGTTTPASTPPKPTGASAVAELRVVSVTPESNRLGRHINVTVQNLDTLLREGRVSPDSFVLFVDGRPVKDAPARLVGPTGTVLSARLEYTTASSEAWLAAFEPIQKGVRIRGPVRIGIGYASGREAPWASDPVKLQFEPYTQLRFVSTVAAVLVTLALLIWMTFRHDLLRDASAPSELPLGRRPFSLARAQAAAWFFAIFASFLYVRLVTGLFENVLNPQALLLLGLSIATQAASRAVDTSRRDSTQETLDELRPQQAELETQVQALQPAVDNLKATVDPAARLALAATHASRTHELGSVTRRIAQAQAVLRGSRSENFLLDLVSDGAGVSLHRVQMVAWTVVLIAIYLTQVYFTLVLPTLSATLVGLMGLSSVAYVGLKPGESQPTPPAMPGNSATPGGTPPQREEVVKVLGMAVVGAGAR